MWSSAGALDGVFQIALTAPDVHGRRRPMTPPLFQEETVEVDLIVTRRRTIVPSSTWTPPASCKIQYGVGHRTLCRLLTGVEAYYDACPATLDRLQGKSLANLRRYLVIPELGVTILLASGESARRLYRYKSSTSPSLLLVGTFNLYWKIFQPSHACRGCLARVVAVLRANVNVDLWALQEVRLEQWLELDEALAKTPAGRTFTDQYTVAPYCAGGAAGIATLVRRARFEVQRAAGGELTPGRLWQAILLLDHRRPAIPILYVNVHLPHSETHPETTNLFLQLQRAILLNLEPPQTVEVVLCGDFNRDPRAALGAFSWALRRPAVLPKTCCTLVAAGRYPYRGDAIFSSLPSTLRYRRLSPRSAARGDGAGRRRFSDHLPLFAAYTYPPSRRRPAIFGDV